LGLAGDAAVKTGTSLSPIFGGLRPATHCAPPDRLPIGGVVIFAAELVITVSAGNQALGC
jgi:hypothetical protein